MRNVIIVLALVGFGAIGLPEPGEAVAQEVRKGDPQNPPLVRSSGALSGQVTGVDEGSITIQGIEADFRGVTRYTTERGAVTYYGKPITLITPARTVKGVQVVVTCEGYTVTDATGGVVVIKERDQPARAFKLGPDLLAGRARKDLAPADSYRIRDVKVGDQVAICYDLLGGDEVCTQIRIYKRPNGAVPPSPNDPGDEKSVKYHDRQNAENDWLDHDIPIPDRFLSERELEARRARIAPMPRPILPRIPEAKP